MQIEVDSLPVQNGESYTVALEQMTFGIIDNIALLKPDNVVYLRLTVQPLKIRIAISKEKPFEKSLEISNIRLTFALL